MSVLPRVSSHTRERMSREFDDLGPAACMAEIVKDLERNNPELLDMASHWASDLGDPEQTMIAFGMFYRLLTAELPPRSGSLEFSLLPRVSADARSAIVGHIDREGAERFTLNAIEAMDKTNPELLQMAHHFASDRADYAQVIHGFALFYAALRVQAGMDRLSAH